MQKLPLGWSLRAPGASPRPSRHITRKRKKAPVKVSVADDNPGDEDSGVDESDDGLAIQPPARQPKTSSAKTVLRTTHGSIPVIQLSTKRTVRSSTVRSAKRARVTSPLESDVEDIVLGRDLGALSVMEDARVDHKVLPEVKGQARRSTDLTSESWFCD